MDGDFFFDCTGFHKRLIVKELDAPWNSYAHELPVNRALPFWIEHDPAKGIPNYTRAWAQECGWMWQIPTQTRFGCGYVYSDEFCTPEQAKLEVERVLGHEIEVRSDIRFQIGRIETPWMANVLAVGLSSSFLEPLESTSIHGTIVQMMLFARRFLKRPAEMNDGDRADYNLRVGRQVDDFRTFVNTHYLTERTDTPFWREVREHRIHPETRERLEHWKHEMPRHEHFPDFLDGLPHIQTQLHYPVLDGLGLLDPEVARAEMARDPKLRQFARETYDVTGQGIPGGRETGAHPRRLSEARPRDGLDDERRREIASEPREDERADPRQDAGTVAGEDPDRAAGHEPGAAGDEHQHREQAEEADQHRMLSGQDRDRDDQPLGIEERGDKDDPHADAIGCALGGEACAPELERRVGQIGDDHAFEGDADRRIEIGERQQRELGQHDNREVAAKFGQQGEPRPLTPVDGPGTGHDRVRRPRHHEQQEGGQRELDRIVHPAGLAIVYSAATRLGVGRAHSGSQSPCAASRSSTRCQIWSRSSSAAVCGSIIAA